MTSIFKKITNALNISGADRSTIVGVDIGSSFIKIVQLKNKSSKIMLDTYGEIALGPYANKEIGEPIVFDVEVITKALADVMKEANITTSNGGFSIQSAATLVLVLEIPKVDKKEMGGVILSEAKRYIPIPMSEVALDWWEIPRPEIANSNNTADDKKTEVLLAVIRNEKLQMYKNVVSQSKVKTSFFEIEMFSAMRSSLGHELSSVVIIDLGASGTRLSIMQYGLVKRFVNIKKGSYQITEMLRKSLGISFKEAEDVKKEVGFMGTQVNGKEQVTQIITSQMRSIFSEVSSAIVEYEKYYGRGVTKIILTGGGARISGLIPFVSQFFTGDIVLADPFSKVDNPEFLNKVLQVTGPEFSVALGLALRNFE